MKYKIFITFLAVLIVIVNIILLLAERSVWYVVLPIMLGFDGFILYIAYTILSEPTKFNILRTTPLGTPIHQVLEIADNKKNWKIVTSKDYGVRLHYGKNPAIDDFVGENTVVIGEKSVAVYLGSKRELMGKYFHYFKETKVTAFFAFDSDEKLIDIFFREDWNIEL